MIEANEKLLEVLKDAEGITVNHAYCEACRGLCCRRCGCSYLPSDFLEFSYSYIKEKLKEGNISIVASMDFDIDHRNRIFAKPLFYLRVRNKGKGVVDLFSYRSRCTQLTPTGCSYSDSERPAFGRAFVPQEKGSVPKEEGGCYHLFDDYADEVKESWEPYQPVLAKLVEDFSGKSVEQITKEQILAVSLEVTKNADSIMRREETLELHDMISGFLNCDGRMMVPSTKGYQKIK